MVVLNQLNAIKLGPHIVHIVPWGNPMNVGYAEIVGS